MWNSSRAVVRLLSLALCAAFFVTATPCRAQSSKRKPTPSSGDGAARISIEDGLSLQDKIKEVESPAFRAYLYTNVAAWLSRGAGDEQTLRRAAVDIAARAVSDMQRHERQIPPTPAAGFYEKLMGVVRRHSPEEAARLERAYPLEARLSRTEAERAGGRLHAALLELDDPKTSARGLEQALTLIGSGAVPLSALHGELLHQGRRDSPALPQLLSATLALEERSAGSVPPLNLFFLSSLYLKEGTPAGLRARFLAAAVAATRRVTAEQRGDPRVFTWAVQLLRTVLPHLRKSNHALHAEAAARLADFAPGAAREDETFERIRESADPLAAALSEADTTDDKTRKRELLKAAAHLLRRQGKLRQAVDLISSTEDEPGNSREGYSGRDEFLDGVLQTALARNDTETARYAYSRIGLHANRAHAARKLARHSFAREDAQAAREHLDEAVKALRDAPEGTARVVAYLNLAQDALEFDAARAPELVREALKAANSIPRPDKDTGGLFSWTLFPVADALTETFRRMAAADRAAASGLAEAVRPSELKVAALLGVYDSAPK